MPPRQRELGEQNRSRFSKGRDGQGNLVLQPDHLDLKPEAWGGSRYPRVVVAGRTRRNLGQHPPGHHGYYYRDHLGAIVRGSWFLDSIVREEGQPRVRHNSSGTERM